MQWSMQNTLIFTDKKGYGFRQYNVEVCTKDEIMIKVKLEECERNTIFMLNEARLKFI